MACTLGNGWMIPTLLQLMDGVMMAVGDDASMVLIVRSAEI